MKKNLIPQNYNENAYAHEMVGAYLWNDLYTEYTEQTDHIVKYYVKREKLPNQIRLAKLPKLGRIVRMAHRWANEQYDEHWKKEKDDTWCARLWIADDIIERVKYALDNI